MSAIGDEIRNHLDEIGRRWESEALEAVAPLQALPRPTRIDHLPEFLSGLADWMEGDDARAREGFRMLAEGHALERLKAGIELSALTTEYSILRRVIIERLVAAVPPDELLASLTALDAGFDCAIYEAIHRYTERRDEIRQRFIDILGHDLRDPLAAIAFSTELLGHTSLSSEAQGLVARIERATRRIVRMIEDVLDFARSRLGDDMPVAPVPGDLGDIVQAAVQESNAGDPQHPVQLEITGDLRGRWDPDRVRQALANLLANARHHGSGEIRLRVWESDDRQRVYTSVTNQGPPIPEAALAQIFDPYVRGSSKRRHGIGLGLFIVQQVALAHGATCHVTSTAADGTTFLIEWPRVPREATPGLV